MIFANQTLDDITNDYFAGNEHSCIENFLIVLKSYNVLRRKKRDTEEFKSYDKCYSI